MYKNMLSKSELIVQCKTQLNGAFKPRRQCRLHFLRMCFIDFLFAKNVPFLFQCFSLIRIIDNNISSKLQSESTNILLSQFDYCNCMFGTITKSSKKHQ